MGFIALASFQDKPIAGGVFFHFGEKATYKYGASDLQYQHLRANNLVMWEAIKWYSQNGYKSLSFGRTELKNQGLIQFKSGWGTTEQQINYYRYDLKKDSFVSGFSRVTGFHNKIFRNTPVPILNRIGNIFYRHVG
jgi:lipid II:glycine glycyltransferase (peptidoglycan interpeptide bridge formation enzyme)